MLKPSENLIDCPHKSHYSLVVAVAKQARKISQEAEENHVSLDEKPVEIAVRDFREHKCLIKEPEDAVI